ncbi:MAG: hypothetical protein WCG99_05145 [Candidatus Berkelbacteria bacterium]
MTTINSSLKEIRVIPNHEVPEKMKKITDTWIWITIDNDQDLNDFQVNHPYCVNILSLFFGENTFDLFQAEKIISFIEQHQNINNLIISCELGQCRSFSIATALADEINCVLFVDSETILISSNIKTTFAILFKLMNNNQSSSTLINKISKYLNETIKQSSTVITEQYAGNFKTTTNVIDLWVIKENELSSISKGETDILGTARTAFDSKEVEDIYDFKGIVIPKYYIDENQHIYNFGNNNNAQGAIIIYGFNSNSKDKQRNVHFVLHQDQWPHVYPILKAANELGDCRSISNSSASMREAIRYGHFMTFSFGVEKKGTKLTFLSANISSTELNMYKLYAKTISSKNYTDSWSFLPSSGNGLNKIFSEIKTALLNLATSNQQSSKDISTKKPDDTKLSFDDTESDEFDDWTVKK